jgi:hypothetical protein
VAGDGRFFAGLADGQIWESSDSWRACAIHGDAVPALLALAYTDG